jgi:hypothetical protein
LVWLWQIAGLFIRALHRNRPGFPGFKRFGVKRTEIVELGRGELSSGVIIGDDHLPPFARPYPRFRYGYEQTGIPALRFFVVPFGGHLVGHGSTPYTTQQNTTDLV